MKNQLITPDFNNPYSPLAEDADAVMARLLALDVAMICKRHGPDKNAYISRIIERVYSLQKDLAGRLQGNGSKNPPATIHAELSFYRQEVTALEVMSGLQGL